MIYGFFIESQPKNDKYNIPGFLTYLEAVTNLLLDELNDCTYC